MALKRPTPEQTRTIRYQNLKGADYSNDPSRVDRDNSPDLLNMIAGLDGTPVKRKGWEKIYEFDNTILDMFLSPNPDWLIIVKTNEVSAYNILTQEVISLITKEYTKPVNHFYMNNGETQSLYLIFDDRLLEVYLSDNVPTVKTPDFYVPTVIIARESGKSGGTFYEYVNVLTRERKDMFYQKSGTAVTLILSTLIDSSKAYSIRYQTTSGWVDFNGTITVSTNKDRLTATLPNLFYDTDSANDNIEVKYFAQGTGNASTVLKSKVSAHFDTGSSERVFVSGNPDFPQHIYYCDSNKPTYFPDINYMIIGGSSTPIKGFLNIGNSLGIIKGSSYMNEPAIYLLLSNLKQTGSETTDTDTGNKTFYIESMQFEMTQAGTGLGAISDKCFVTINDEPMFLSERGIHGILGTSLEKEKIVRNRSIKLDGYLLNEPNLENAKAVRWKDFYALFINSHVYLLDGRQKSQERINTDYSYEGYYWENFPADTVLSTKTDLFFSADSNLLRLKTTDDMEAYSDDGNSILARWSTPNDSAGTPEMLKTMVKRGSIVTLAPFRHSSCDLYYEKDGGEKTYVGTYVADVSDLFIDVNFDKFSFDTRKGPRDYAFQTKIKKYKRMKLIFENNELNEGFGLHEIVVTYKDIKKIKK